MYPSAFVRLVEDEYAELLRTAISLSRIYEFKEGQKPDYICIQVQKFRNWLAYAIRSVDLNYDGVSYSSEDVLAYAAMSRSRVYPFGLLHPKLASALTLFNSDEFTGIFGSERRESFEKGAEASVSVCQFRVCFAHCSKVIVQDRAKGMIAVSAAVVQSQKT